MTCEIYRDKILPSVVGFIRSSRFGTRLNVLLLHHNAPAHLAADVKEYFGEQGI